MKHLLSVVLGVVPNIRDDNGCAVHQNGRLEPGDLAAARREVAQLAERYGAERVHEWAVAELVGHSLTT